MVKKRKKIKGLVLFSGGLDSLLSIKILEKQGIEIAGICFSSKFFTSKKARRIANKNKVKLFVKDFNKEIFELVKKPKHGLGKNMNPCIDCHSTMFLEAKKFAKENDFDFLASGEVLGQRPFSQNKSALEKVTKNLDGEILRPLSAKLLPETEVEKVGLVDRKKLFDFQGRQRKAQLDLAKKMGIKYFETPAGGCMLTDPGFSKKLKEALEIFPKIQMKDIELLKYGRVFWIEFLGKPILVVIGRNKEENEKLCELKDRKDTLFTPKETKGPDVLIRAWGFYFNQEFKTIKQEVELSSEPPKLQGKKFKNLKKMFQEIIKVAGWYIPKARGKEIIFKNNLDF